MTTANYKGIQVYVLATDIATNKALVKTVDGRKAFGSGLSASSMKTVPADEVEVARVVHELIVQS